MKRRTASSSATEPMKVICPNSTPRLNRNSACGTASGGRPIAVRAPAKANPCNNPKRNAITQGCRIDQSEEHTSELQSLMRNSYAVYCMKKKKQHQQTKINTI